jgi:hypothetical protein
MRFPGHDRSRMTSCDGNDFKNAFIFAPEAGHLLPAPAQFD